jgi:DNA modification methylase
MRWNVIEGDCREVMRRLPEQSVQTCITSPPYFGLRDYGHDGQIGLEPTPDDFVAAMVEVFCEVRRVLKDDGTVWLNLGDSYNGSGPSGGDGKQYTNIGSQGTTTKRVAGLKRKDLIGIPWRVAFTLQADGWYLRQDIIWHKPNPMPESVRDRCTKAHEYIFLLSKSPKYYYDADAIKEPAAYAGESRGGSTNRYEQNEAGMDCREYDTRNKRSVWSVCPKPFREAHFATYPPDLIEPCVLAGCPAGGTVLDPFNGAGTTGVVSVKHGRNYIGIELNPEYADMARRRIKIESDKFSLFGL